MSTQANSEGLYGLDTKAETSAIHVIQVPWEATTSYGAGASEGPKAILEASPQLDLFDVELGNAYEVGYHLLAEDSSISELNKEMKIKAQTIIKEWDETGKLSLQNKELQKEVNQASETINNYVYQTAKKIIKQNKIPSLIGGDHSTPYGLIKALSEEHESFGILHIDAHADLRLSYQGFHHSHASIMNNVLHLEKAPTQLTQVAIRDFCEEEWEIMSENEEQVICFFDRQLKSAMFDGISWQELCEDIAATLPEKVYISFDIDGLSPEFCPGTGTPVPGGLSFDQAVHLLGVLGSSGRKIIGFDLNEVAPSADSEWDGNVGARILFKLLGWTAVSNGFYELG